MAYLTSKELLDRFKIKSQTTLWRWQKPTQKVFNAPFPPPVKVSVDSTSLWDEEQIITWENQHFRNNKSLTKQLGFPIYPTIACKRLPSRSDNHDSHKSPALLAWYDQSLTLQYHAM